MSPAPTATAAGGAKKAAGKRPAKADPNATKRPAPAGAATKAGGKPAGAKPAAAGAKPAAAGQPAAAAAGGGQPAAGKAAGGAKAGGAGPPVAGGRRQPGDGRAGAAPAPAPAPPKPPPPPMTVRKVAYEVKPPLGACDAKVAAMEAALAERHALIAGAVTSFSAKLELRL